MRLSTKQRRAMFAKIYGGKSTRARKSISAAPRGKAWSTERGENAYKNKSEPYEYERGRKLLKKKFGV